MTARSPWWIDWSLARRALLRELPGRAALFLVMAFLYVALVLSWGVGRFLAAQWPVSAILARDVSDEEGLRIAGQLARLPAVESAVYRDAEFAWKEFLAAYPGLEVLREAGGNPLSGYIEIRMRPERLTERDVSAVAGRLAPLPQVERVLSGGEALPRVLRLKTWVNGALCAALGLFAAAVFWVMALQERARVLSLRPDVAFLVDRGISAASIGRRRAAAAALAGGVLGVMDLAAAAGLLYLLRTVHPAVATAVGGIEELGRPPAVLFAAAFPAAAALLGGAAAALGWRAGAIRSE